MTADAAACRNLCAEHGFAWIHRIGSLLSLSLSLSLFSRATWLRGRADTLTHTKQPLDRARAEAPRHDARASIGFAFFRPIIYQSRLPPLLPRSLRVAFDETRQQRKREKERGGRIQLGTIVPPGRRIMRLFKGRKFSSVAGRGKSIFRTLSTPRVSSRRIYTPHPLRGAWGETVIINIARIQGDNAFANAITRRLLLAYFSTLCCPNEILSARFPAGF